jgi:phage FluMu gp28-like protein
VHQAVKQGLPLDIELEKKAMGDPTGWAQEFELQWIDEASVWLPYELMEPCENEDAGSPDLYQGQPCYIGIDIGRHSHRWVAWVLERMSDGKFWTREVVVLQNASFAEHDRVVARLMKQYRVIKLAADKTGIGEKPVEDWQNIYSEYRVEGVSFSNASKYALATIGRKAFEDQSWFVPDDDETREDFYKLKRSATATGAPRFDAAADSSGHADRAWAAFLALYAAGTIGDVAFSSSGSYTTSHWDEPANDETEIGGVLAVGGESWDTW